MIQCQLKLRMCKSQEKNAESWLPILGSVYNFAVRKIELNAKDKIYFSKQEFQNLLANHGEKVGIPSHTLQGVLCTVHDAKCRYQYTHSRGGIRPREGDSKCLTSGIPEFTLGVSICWRNAASFVAHL